MTGRFVRIFSAVDFLSGGNLERVIGFEDVESERFMLWKWRECRFSIRVKFPLDIINEILLYRPLLTVLSEKHLRRPKKY